MLAVLVSNCCCHFSSLLVPLLQRSHAEDTCPLTSCSATCPALGGCFCAAPHPCCCGCTAAWVYGSDWCHLLCSGHSTGCKGKGYCPPGTPDWKAAGELWGRCNFRKLSMLGQDPHFILHKQWQSIFLHIIHSIPAFLLHFYFYPHRCLFFLPRDWQNLRGNK